MRNVVFDAIRKIRQTYYIEKSYSTAYYFDKANFCIRSFTKYVAIFRKKHFKKRITQYFLTDNKSPWFLAELSKQNLLQLNMSKNESFDSLALRKPH